MKSVAKEKAPWYVGGLHFECGRCGKCCSGPDEGYIWVTEDEIRLIADYLKISEEDLAQKYMVRVGLRTSIIEHRPANDCIFLEAVNGHRVCMIYPVRPNQCRTWPFWDSNLASAEAWNHAAKKCFGINRGRRHSLEQIEKKKEQKQWWR
jgi:Fe-S-cluster containining protein